MFLLSVYYVINAIFVTSGCIILKDSMEIHYLVYVVIVVFNDNCKYENLVIIGNIVDKIDHNEGFCCLYLTNKCTL